VLLGNEDYQWFYWIAPILAVSFLLVLGGLTMGYIRKVMIPRHKGRRVE
jgi:hypothetical protein